MWRVLMAAKVDIPGVSRKFGHITTALVNPINAGRNEDGDREDKEERYAKLHREPTDEEEAKSNTISNYPGKASYNLRKETMKPRIRGILLAYPISNSPISQMM